MITPESKFIRNNDIAWRIIEGEALVVSPKDSLVYPLNDVGTRVWELLDGKRAVSEIGAVICEEFDADETTIRKDIADFVENLLKAGLVDGM